MANRAKRNIERKRLRINDEIDALQNSIPRIRYFLYDENQNQIELNTCRKILKENNFTEGTYFNYKGDLLNAVQVKDILEHIESKLAQLKKPGKGKKRKWIQLEDGIKALREIVWTADIEQVESKLKKVKEDFFRDYALLNGKSKDFFIKNKFELTQTKKPSQNIENDFEFEEEWENEE